MRPDFNKMELIPAIVQDYQTKEVLMLAYVNEEAYDKMLELKQTVFYSRSRQKLWHKGEESGHFQDIKGMYLDCDLDTLLIYVKQTGAACHTGAYSCFFNEVQAYDARDIFRELEKTIADRKIHPVEKSYTNYLLNEGVDKICKKVGEEASETIIAAKNEDVLQNQFLLDATFLGYYSDETLKIAQKLCALNQGMLDIEESDLEIMKKAAKENDYLGMNYYQSRFIQAYDGENDIYHNGTGEKGTSRFRLKGVGERMNKEGIDRTDWDWLIHPESMFDMLVRIKQQYPQYKAIYITENGMGYKDDFEDGIIDDTPRIDYVRRHLYYLLKAIEAGVNVKGYFIWSLMDMFSWTNGYNKRYGLFYIDYKTQKRYPKASAYWYKYISQTKELF